MRDARIVRDLVLDGARDAAAFAPYGEERVGRMARLRFIADIQSVREAEDADNRSARRAMVAAGIAAGDPQILTLLLSAFSGPENIPDDALDPRILERIRAA
jgi:hypothetical protein